MIRKYRNLKERALSNKITPPPPPKKNTNHDDDVAFVKQVPAHPRDRLARVTKDDVVFVKQVPVHPRDRLVRATKMTLF